MKKFIKILLYINLAIFLYGIYLQYIAHSILYQKVMGFGVLFLVFILLPIFLWYRYKDKKIEDFQFRKPPSKKDPKDQ